MADAGRGGEAPARATAADAAIGDRPSALTRPEVRLGLLLLVAVGLVAAVAAVVRHELRARYHESSWDARVLPDAPPAGPLHVEAIFYAAEARLMRPGQPATVSPDAAPEVALPGHVASLAGAADAPVPFPAPPDASPARVAVRIAVRDAGDTRRLLAPGLPVTVRVYTFAGPRG